MINCPECGVIAESMTDICSNCGYPLNSLEIKTGEKQKPKSVFKKKWFWILTICLVLSISVISIVFNSAKTEN